MRPPHLLQSIIRIRIPPHEEPGAGPGIPAVPRPRGSRRPHSDAKVAAVRRLVEDTPLTYGEIAARTGVARASICRWTRDGGWRRHAFAPRATDTVPRARAGAHLKRRLLSVRLSALAERHVRELEDAACVDPDKLAEALELLRMAKLAARPRLRRPAIFAAPAADPTPFVPAQAGTQSSSPKGHRVAGTQPHSRDDTAVAITPPSPQTEPMRPIGELCVAGVDLSRAPRAAVEDFLAHRAPPAEDEMTERGQRKRPMSRKDEEHRWMMRKRLERPA
jgi:hypothetical protein